MGPALDPDVSRKYVSSRIIVVEKLEVRAVALDAEPAPQSSLRAVGRCRCWSSSWLIVIRAANLDLRLPLTRLLRRYFGAEAHGSVKMQVQDCDMVYGLNVGAGVATVFVAAFFPLGRYCSAGFDERPLASVFVAQSKRIHSLTGKRKKQGILPKRKNGKNRL